MRVDIAVQNTQPIDSESLLFPSEVKITLNMYYKESDAFVTTPIQSQEFTFTNTGTQNVTFDINRNLATENSIYLTYKIEAPAEIPDRDFDEADLFEEVEEAFGVVHLYPVGLGIKENIQTYVNGNVYETRGDTTGQFSGIAAVATSDGTLPPDPVIPKRLAILGLIGNNSVANMPNEYSQFSNMPKHVVTIKERELYIDGTGWFGTGTQVELRNELFGAIRVPLTYADNTNLLRQRLLNDYTNIRYVTKLIPAEPFYSYAMDDTIAHGVAFPSGTDGDPDSLLVKPREGNVEPIVISVIDTRISSETTDFLEIDLLIRRPFTFLSDNDPENTSKTVGDFGPLQPFYALFRIEIEVEVQNPTTGLYSIYAPRIRIPEVDYLFVYHAKISS